MKVIIFAGGNATRLWPTVRKGSNKPFIRFFNGKTSLELMYTALKEKFKDSEIYISTGEEFASEVKELLPRIPDKNLILEPLSKDSGPAVVYAFFNIINNSDPDEPVLIVWTNGVVKKPELFIQTINAAEKHFLEEELKLMFFGVPQRYPNSSVGHIQGDKNSEVSIKYGIPVQEFEGFKEKPKQDAAEEYYKEREECFWNTGYYIARPSFILKEVEEHNKEFYSKFVKVREFLSTDNSNNEIKEIFDAVESCSIDYLLWEKISYKNVKVVIADYDWHYISQWEQLAAVLEKDKDGNTLEGNTRDLDVKDSYFRNEDDAKLLVGIGVENLVVINSNDAILVLYKKDAGKVRDIVRDLRE